MECVRRALEQLGGEVISGTKPVFDRDDEGKDTLVDAVGCGQRNEGAESEVFTFTDALMQANLLSETVLDRVVSSFQLPLCYFLFFIFPNFFHRKNIGADRIFHELVHRARSNKKMASWGYCVLVNDSSAEAAGVAFACPPGGSGSKFEVGRAPSCNEVPGFVQSPPTCCSSRL